MLKKFLVPLFICASMIAHAQTEKDFVLGGSLDLIKTDNLSPFKKTQVGLEGNYFVTRHFAAGAGLEFWTGDGVSVVVGGRWFPVEEAFIRFRGLIGENDFSVGAGWTKPIRENLRFEAIGDFYFSIDFAIRVGMMYIIRK